MLQPSVLCRKLTVHSVVGCLAAENTKSSLLFLPALYLFTSIFSFYYMCYKYRGLQFSLKTAQKWWGSGARLRESSRTRLFLIKYCHHMFMSLPHLHNYLFKVFFGLFDNTAEEGDRKQGAREGEWHAAKGTRRGVEPGSAAAPQHMGCPLYQLS